MSLLDDLAGTLGAAISGGTPAPQPQPQAGGLNAGALASLLPIVLGMLNNQQSGGLGGLVQNFIQKGLGDVVSSWVGTGQNLPISAEQIQHVLGSDQIQQIAAQAGMSPETASASLASLLPGLVDKATPEGKIPEGGGLFDEGLSALLRG